MHALFPLSLNPHLLTQINAFYLNIVKESYNNKKRFNFSYSAERKSEQSQNSAKQEPNWRSAST